MKLIHLLLLIPLMVVGCNDDSSDSSDSTDSSSLVQIDSKELGADFSMKIIEIERTGNISKLKLITKKMGASVESSMFIALGFYKVAKDRNMKYFINLKEWDDAQGNRIYIAGFTNTKNANILAEFGDQYSLKNEYDQPSEFLSVYQFDILWGDKK